MPLSPFLLARTNVPLAQPPQLEFRHDQISTRPEFRHDQKFTMTRNLTHPFLLAFLFLPFVFFSLKQHVRCRETLISQDTSRPVGDKHSIQ